MSPLTEVETQKESNQERHVEVMTKLNTPTAKGGFINGLTGKVNAFELNNYIDSQVSQALLSDRARLVEELEEKFAAQAHEQWSGWMRYLFSKGKRHELTTEIPKVHRDRWERQMETPYDQLSEEEKESDRVEARKFLSIIKESR